MAPTYDEIRRAPKALLHDHLDGGLRPATIVELAAEIGHELPATDPAELGEWFTAAADSGSLERYLETFVHTVGVMQTASALHRVAGHACPRRPPSRGACLLAPFLAAIAPLRGKNCGGGPQFRPRRKAARRGQPLARAWLRPSQFQRPQCRRQGRECPEALA